MPEPPAEPPAPGSAPRLSSQELTALLRSPQLRPLHRAAAWARAVRGPGDLAALNLFSVPAEATPLGVEAALLTLRAEPNKLLLGGRVATREPLRVPTQKNAAHLARAAERPVVAASAWFDKEVLASVLLGAPNSWRRRLAGSRVEALGVDAQELFASLAGRATVLAYFDSDLYWMGFLENELPLPASTLVLETSLEGRAPLERYLKARAAQAGVTLRHRRAGGESVYTGDTGAGGLSLKINDRRAQLTLGDVKSRRPNVNLLQQLRARFGPETFGPGHASLLVDLRVLREELDRPIDLEGLTEEDAQTLQRFGGLLLWQMGPIEHLFVDLAAAPGGLALRGEITFEPFARATEPIGAR